MFSSISTRLFQVTCITTVLAVYIIFISVPNVKTKQELIAGQLIQFSREQVCETWEKTDNKKMWSNWFTIGPITVDAIQSRWNSENAFQTTANSPSNLIHVNKHWPWKFIFSPLSVYSVLLCPIKRDVCLSYSQNNQFNPNQIESNLINIIWKIPYTFIAHRNQWFMSFLHE